MTDDAPTVDSFDLVDEPWITVRRRSGEVADISLRGLFHQAGELREIVGEVPTQTFALTRLALAVLYRSIAGSRLTGERWQSFWEQGLPLPLIDAHLDAHRDRFDLLHPAHPFFQVADLHTAKQEFKGVDQLIFDLPNNNRLFTTRAGTGIERLSFAEAARWLVNLQAFDISGIKSGAVGDQRVMGGRGYPIGVAWSGQLGGVLVEGDTVAQTLLLNLVGPSQYTDEWDDDLAPWEREPDGPAERGAPRTYPKSDGWRGRPPRGPVDLATWQSRRVRLVSDGRGIVASLVGNGDRRMPENLFGREMMTAWRLSEPQTKKFGYTVYWPREHQPGRALWRGIGALLPKTAIPIAGREAASAQPPGSVQWLSALQENGELSRHRLVRLRAIGVVYGSQNAMVDDVVDDRVLVSLALLHEANRALAREAELAVTAAEAGVRAVRRLAENLSRAAGGGADGPRQRADETAYAALDAPFRRWLSTLNADTDPGEAQARWKATAHDVLRRCGDTLVAAAPPAAWRGREVAGLGRQDLITTSRAQLWFRRALRTTFGTATGEDSAR